MRLDVAQLHGVVRCLGPVLVPSKVSGPSQEEPPAAANNAPPSSSYIWTDPSDYETTNSTYIFNVCANIAMPPQWAQICPSGRGPAYQIINDQGSEACFALGTSLATQRSDKATWSLVDPTDPSRGVSLTYLSPFNDGLCPNGQPRSFTIDFGCADYPFPPPGQAPGAAHIANVDEVNMCNYRAHSWSRAGCPLRASRLSVSLPLSPTTPVLLLSLLRPMQNAPSSTMRSAAGTASAASTRARMRCARGLRVR